MAKIEDVVQETVDDLEDLVAELEDEDDPEALLLIFDKISERADKTAGILDKVNQALSGSKKERKKKAAEVEVDEDTGEVEDDDEEEEAPPTKKSKKKSSRTE